jgi:hypothetical protein
MPARTTNLSAYPEPRSETSTHRVDVDLEHRASMRAVVGNRKLLPCSSPGCRACKSRCSVSLPEMMVPGCGYARSTASGEEGTRVTVILEAFSRIKFRTAREWRGCWLWSLRGQSGRQGRRWRCERWCTGRSAASLAQNINADYCITHVMV